MNIVMFTPGLQSSAIGRMAALVTRALVGSGHQVTVVRSEEATLCGEPSHEFGAPVLAWNDFAQVSAAATAADALVYQIGDNFQYHEGCLRWMSQFPGVVCLHDFFLGNLFHGWAQDRRREAESIVAYWYGDEIARRYFSYPDSASFIDATAATAPMTEWLASMCPAVVTHSSWGLPRVLAACPGPVQVTPLAYDAPALVKKAQGVSAGDNTLRLLTIGHVNPNKRVESVIRAVGASRELRGQITYRLVGQIDPATSNRLTLLAKEHGVDLIVSGSVDQATLTEAVHEAHAISCLRWPSLEAASASAIEAMLYGKPTIVTRTGFYLEIPDDCVATVRPDHEIDDLCVILERLKSDVNERQRLGAAAQAWASRTFSAANYAMRLEQMIVAQLRTRPALLATHWCIDQLRAWGATQELVNEFDLANTLDVFEAGPTANRTER